MPPLETVRVVLTADTHLGFDTASRARVARRRRGADFTANYQRVLDHARQVRADLLVHCGDVFHCARVPAGVVDEAFETLAGVTAAGVSVVIVPGNHDRSRLPLSLWLGHPNIYVLDRPRTVRLEVRKVTIAIAGFPFARGISGSFPRLVKETAILGSGADLSLLCMHQTVEGARVGPGGFEFRAGKEAIAYAALPTRLDAVLAGHVHRSQVLGVRGHPPVFYPGSVERTSFAERQETKGFFEIEFHRQGPGRRMEFEATFHTLPSRPMVDLPLPQCSTRSELYEHLRSAAGGLDRDAVVRIIGGPSVDEAVASFLKADLLRAAFPETMNVQLSGEFTRARE